MKSSTSWSVVGPWGWPRLIATPASSPDGVIPVISLINADAGDIRKACGAMGAIPPTAGGVGGSAADETTLGDEFTMAPGAVDMPAGMVENGGTMMGRFPTAIALSQAPAGGDVVIQEEPDP